MVGLRVFDVGALIVWLVWFFRLRDDDDDDDDFGARRRRRPEPEEPRAPAACACRCRTPALAARAAAITAATARGPADRRRVAPQPCRRARRSSAGPIPGKPIGIL